MKNINYALTYLNQHLLDCETGMDEIWVTINGIGETVEIVDVLGTVEDEGRIYVGLEIITNDFPFGHIIHINFLNTWDFVYKDEMIEIQDVLSNLISEKLKTDLGIQGTVLDDVKEWAEELAEEYDNGQIGALNDLMHGGIQSGIVSHLIYNGDIMDFYDEHYTEIDEILERDNKKMVGTIKAVWYAWEIIAYDYLKSLESKKEC